MTIDTLDTILRNISDHEKSYQLGKGDPNYQKFPWIEKDGQLVMTFLFSNISAEYGTSPFIVKKHSRFRSFPLHFHNWIELNYMYSGTCTQVIGKNAYKMKKGQVLLMDPNMVHTIEPLGENDILINIAVDKKYLNSNFFNRLSSGSILSSFFINAYTENTIHDNLFLFPSENSRRLEIFMNEFLCEWMHPSITSEDILNSLFSLIISELVNVLKDTTGYSENMQKKNSIVPVLRYIEGNYKTCTLKSLAAFFNMNPNYLSNQLKKHTGYSFKELVIQQKLSASEQLLRSSDMSVIEIASYVGYENISFFYKKFKEKCGCLPGEYRNRFYPGFPPTHGDTSR